jgi:hypothetical protein
MCEVCVRYDVILCGFHRWWSVVEVSFIKEGETRVEAGSNTSTVTLRVVGGNKKGSLKSETVKYGPKSQGTTIEKDCAGKGQRRLQKTDPSSCQRGCPTE